MPYRSPGAYQADWVRNPAIPHLPTHLFVLVSDTPARPQVDLYNRLYRERIVYLGQQISDDIANQIIGVMLYLDSEVRSSHPPRCVRLVALRAEACAC